MASALGRLFREPLVQFAAIGLVLFAVDQFTRAAPDDPRLIRVDAKVHRDLADVFQGARGRLPTAAEMDAMVERWVTNETIFREARALRLDEGDDMIRQRLVQRMRLMMASGIEAPQPDDATLSAWFAENASMFANPTMISFRVIGLDASEHDARAVAEEANAREAAGAPVAEPGRTVATFRERPRASLVAIFNEQFVEGVEGADPGVWTAAPFGARGWQVVRLTKLTPGYVPALEEIRLEVAEAWRQEQVRAEADAALDALKRSYPTLREPYGAGVVASDNDAAQADRASATGEGGAE